MFDRQETSCHANNQVTIRWLRKVETYVTQFISAKNAVGKYPYGYELITYRHGHTEYWSRVTDAL